MRVGILVTQQEAVSTSPFIKAQQIDKQQSYLSEDVDWISILSISLTFPNHAATQITQGRSILSTGTKLSCSTICIDTK
jgi:hypothetical protein